METKLNLAAVDIFTEFFHAGQSFSYDSNGEEIHAMVFGNPSNEWKDWMEEIASDFGLDVSETKFSISDYFKEKYNAEFGYSYTFRA